MAAVTLTGSGAVSSAGRGFLSSVFFSGRGGTASGGRAFLRLTQPLSGRGGIASGGRLNTGLVSQLTAKAISITDRLASGTPTVLTNSIMREWREELSEAGFGSFVLMHDNALTGSVDWLPNQLVDFYIGSTLAYTILVEQYESVDIDERAEEREQKTQYKGRGHVAVTDRIATYPALGVGHRPIEEDRAFNYTNPAYDDTAWIPATHVATVGEGKTIWVSGLPFALWDEDFPDDTASILWASDGTTTNAGTGDCYFRHQITVPNTGPMKLFAGVDNRGEVFFDGASVMTPGYGNSFKNVEFGFTVISAAFFESVTAGTHYIAATGTNQSSAGNPAGVAWALYETDENGVLGTLIAHSNPVEVVMVEYASEPPGMTPGEAIILCLDEALERQADPLWQEIRDNLTFTDREDSSGNSWPIYADMGTKIGTSLFVLLRELAATYIDFSMTPGSFILNAWIKGGRSTGRNTLYFSPTNPANQATGNLLRLRRSGEA